MRYLTRAYGLKPEGQRYEVADEGGLFIDVQPSGAKVGGTATG